MINTELWEKLQKMHLYLISDAVFHTFIGGYIFVLWHSKYMLLSNESNQIYVISVLSLQWGLHVPFPQQKLTSLQYAPPSGPAVSLRRWSPVGERHGDVDSVGRWLCTHRLEGFPQDPERGCAATWHAVSWLQGWTLVRRRRSCGEPAGQKVLRSERQTLRRESVLRLFLRSVLCHWHAQFYVNRTLFFFEAC